MKLLGEDQDAIRRAAEALRDGGLVAFPTETVYGLGADARNSNAVARIFEAKGRPRFNPLIVHVLGLDQAALYGEVNERARKLADRFWPGPLTMVLRRNVECALSALVSAGQETVALRSPAHPVARRLLEAAALPVAAPSANPSGYLSPTRACHVAEAFTDLDALLIDGGPCAVGLESTVVDVSGVQGAVLLRSGSISLEEVAAVVGSAEVASPDAPVQAPGMLLSHYAPNKPLRMDADAPQPHESFLGFGEASHNKGALYQNLSLTGDLVEAAANLFDMLHRAEQQASTGIAVAPIPGKGLGAAINDRLRRAAHGD
jgi:L-threonylcarbamoyladenylate synthase